MIQHSFSQEKTPIQTVKIIEESSHVLGSGLELSLTEKGEEYLHKELDALTKGQLTSAVPIR